MVATELRGGVGCVLRALRTFLPRRGLKYTDAKLLNQLSRDDTFLGEFCSRVTAHLLQPVPLPLDKTDVLAK